MTLLFPEARTRRAPSLESTFVMASAALLCFLALSDRVTAWLIGEFPASAMLWQLRFEFLRPIGVYHDFAVLALGQVSSAAFCLMVAAAALAIAVAVLSRIRLLRALACHALLGCAAMLWVCSLQYHEGIYAPAGVPSASYAFVGALLAVPAAVLCLGIHAEYVGWNPAGSMVVRRSRIALRRVRRRADGALSDLVDRFSAASGAGQIALAPLRIVVRARTRR